ncbi:RagB/SusD family nutrient uptake outer membrane protein [Pedobacter sp. N36a]|uniref:RagB/SusD family nutrient uptake outer membrane protein n=1 Tax=Pedobacter sp. N36a TaxID=2767996 RepID=UPI0016574BC8|nr:RagB/SusD family nutrient uptake outer membrane protein [Pedobacter sp. N36a]MBC8988180.1 RagB/SusD family nutrient uptake outer membrane protein [Pedobacter sp. N36a]
MKKIILHLLLITAVALLFSCQKEFLEIKQNKNRVSPTSIADFQSLLDNSNIMNAAQSFELGVIGADEFIVTDAVWDALARPYQKQGYIWAKNVYQGIQLADWNNAYWRILYANTALEGAVKIKPATSEQGAWANLKGSALFFRAFNFFQLSQLFCKPYNSSKAASDLGIVLRLEADINPISTRATVESTYQQIIADLTEAADLLDKVPVNKLRPSKQAAYALLAKTYLLMGNYPKAGFYADQCLKINSQLINFNEIALNARYTFLADYNRNKEVLFYANMANAAIIASTRLNMNPGLLKLYSADDLRYRAYFYTNTDARILFKGGYTGSSIVFTGLATDEQYLIRAECLARTGDHLQAMRDLNTLLKMRYDKATFKDLTASNAEVALSTILQERKKELVMRGIRWEDLRRLNKEKPFETKIIRTVNGITYELLPNDIRYVWPIPESEILLSGFEQNPR